MVRAAARTPRFAPQDRLNSRLLAILVIPEGFLPGARSALKVDGSILRHRVNSPQNHSEAHASPAGGGLGLRLEHPECKLPQCRGTPGLAMRDRT